MAVSNSIGIAMLPDYLIGQDDNLVRIAFNAKLPEIDTYLTYAEERRNSKRIAVFREFIIEKGKSGHSSIAKNAYLFCVIMHRFAYIIKLICLYVYETSD